MLKRIFYLIVLVALAIPGIAQGQQTTPSSNNAPGRTSAQQEQKAPAPDESSPKPDNSAGAQDSQAAPLDPDMELQIAVQQAGNDRAALIRNLEAFLKLHPDSPRRAAIYRAILESEMQSRNTKVALEYAEKAIALEPDDIQSMFMAITVLEQMPDDASQAHGIDYDSRLIDRVTKADPDSRPQNMTLDDWQSGRVKFMTGLYVLRGRMERHLHKNDDAIKDLTQGFQLQPNADAAMDLGEIAEEQKRGDEAIHQYALAFFLPGLESSDVVVNRDSIRARIGNLWHYTHESNAGLGDVLLDAFDKGKALAVSDKPEPPAHNEGVTDPLQFALRHVEGNDAVKMGDLKGKIVILNFWTTWCVSCRTFDSLLGDVRKKFVDRDDVVSLAVNADEEQSLVVPSLTQHKFEGTIVFADGLDKAFHVALLPTVIVLDRSGKVAYRSQGFAPDGFVDAVSSAITKASAPPGK